MYKIIDVRKKKKLLGQLTGCSTISTQPGPFNLSKINHNERHSTKCTDSC